MDIVNGFDIDTVEGATKYLESEGVDVDKYIARGTEELRKSKTENHPCPNCQGGGCPVCSGCGEIPA